MNKTSVEKLISLLIVLILVFVSTGYGEVYSAATGFVADGIHSFYIGYKNSVVAQFNDDYSVLTVFRNGEKGTGAMKNWVSPYSDGYSYNPAYEHADTLKKVIICDGVVSIGDYFCFECNNLECVEFSSGVKRIGNSSFRKSGLTSLTLPEKLTSVGERAFSGCHALRGNLIIPDSVKTVGDFAFYNCYSLDGTLTLGSSLTSIGISAFCKCLKLSGSLILPQNLETLGAYCFENCENFSGELVLNEGLVHIGDGAFNHCKNFANTALIIPSTLCSIGGDTAYDVTAYEANIAEAPAEPYNHGSHVFYDFANACLKEYCVDEGNAYFTSLDGVLYTSDMKRLVAYPVSKECSEFAIPEGVEIIDEMAFGRSSYSFADKKLKTVILPDSYLIKTVDDYRNSLNREAMCSLSSAVYLFTSVENYRVNQSNPNYTAKDGCICSKDGSFLICTPAGKKGILNVPQGVTKVGYGAFAGCNDVEYFTFPLSTAEISELAFDYCTDADIICYEDSAVQSFSGIDGCNVHNYGDVNDDGDITLIDYAVIEDVISGRRTSVSTFESLTGDYNRDFCIDAFDLFGIDKRINVGLRSN